MTKKQKKKKVSFSLGGLVSGCHHNTTDHFDHVESFLSASPEEVAMALPQDLPVEAPQPIGNWMSMYETIVYDSENTVTSKTLSILTPIVVHAAHHQTVWESCLALVVL